MKNLIGHVTHYYTRLGVAVLELNGELKLGDQVVFLGHTTDFSQGVCSIEVEHHRILSAGSGEEVALKVDEPVRVGDEVFLLEEEGEIPENRVLWKMMRATGDTLYNLYEPTYSNFSSARGSDRRRLGTLVWALTFEPDTITPEKLLRRSPYNAETAYTARLHEAVDQGFMFEPEPGEFRLTGAGREAAQKLVSDIRKVIAQSDPLQPSDGSALARLLGRIVQSCLSTSPPPEPWSIQHSFALMPPIDPPLPYSEQAISCLEAYRDDSHLAAWQPSELSAAALESLTLLWRGDLHTLADLQERLVVRGHEPHIYQDSLSELRQRGFIEGTMDGLKPTSAGREFRQQVEVDTDHLFFAPWCCLKPVEKVELSCLLDQLRQGINSTR